MHYFRIIISSLILLSSCQQSKNKTKTTVNEKQIDVSQPFTTNGYVISSNDALLKNFDDAHNSKNTDAFKKLYAPNVFYYTKEKTLDEVLKMKAAALQKSPDYIQKSTFVEDFIYNDRIEVFFDKTFTISGKSNTVRSILILARIDTAKSEFKIIEESDLPSKKYLKKQDKTISNDADFNGDGKKEYAEIIAPKIIEEEMNCENGDCITEIKFSDNSIKNIEINNCIGGMLELEGDLNNDGAEEIGILDDWFTSRWGRYIVYTNKNSTWQVLTTLSVDRFTVMDDAKLRSSLVRKIGKNKVEISNYIWNDEQADMVIKKSIITIP